MVGPVLVLCPRAGTATDEGTPGQMCTHGTVSVQGTFMQKAQLELNLPDWDAAPLQRLARERKVQQWVTVGSFEEDKLEKKLLVRSLCCSISNISLNLPLKSIFKILGFRQKYFPSCSYSLFFWKRFPQISHGLCR